MSAAELIDQLLQLPNSERLRVIVAATRMIREDQAPAYMRPYEEWKHEFDAMILAMDRWARSNLPSDVVVNDSRESIY